MAKTQVRFPDLTDYPEYAEVSDRLTEFKLRALDLEREIRGAELAHNSGSARTVTAVQAEELLSGGDGGVAALPTAESCCSTIETSGSPRSVTT